MIRDSTFSKSSLLQDTHQTLCHWLHLTCSLNNCINRAIYKIFNTGTSECTQDVWHCLELQELDTIIQQRRSKFISRLVCDGGFGVLFVAVWLCFAFNALSVLRSLSFSLFVCFLQGGHSPVTIKFPDFSRYFKWIFTVYRPLQQ